MKYSIQGGSFDSERHEYLDENGIWVPSCTQVLKLARYSTFDFVSPDVLKNAADRGTRLHKMTELWELNGEEPDPDWTPEEEMERFKAFVKWALDNDWKPEKVEYPMVVSVYGMKFGVTLDGVGRLRGVPTILEKKFTAAPSKSWSIQTGAQELALTGTTSLGRYQRVVCHVNSKFKATPILCRDSRDAEKFVFALGTLYTRLDLGHDVLREILALGEEE